MRPLILSSLLATFLWSAPIGGVSIMVKNSPITLYEVQQEMKQSGTNAQQSADTLIRKKLEQLEAEEKKITVSPAEINEEIARLAKQNNISEEQFFATMKSVRGLDESGLKKRIEESIIGQKLYQAIAFSKMSQPTPTEESEYYQLHLDEFSKAESYSVTAYTTTSSEALQAQMNDPMRNIEGVTYKDETIPSHKLNPQLVKILNKIKVGEFSPILPNGKNGFMVFYMKEKNNLVSENLDTVRPVVNNMIMEEKRNQVLNDYFTRLRLNSEVKIVRLP